MALSLELLNAKIEALTTGKVDREVLVTTVASLEDKIGAVREAYLREIVEQNTSTSAKFIEYIPRDEAEEFVKKSEFDDRLDENYFTKSEFKSAMKLSAVAEVSPLKSQLDICRSRSSSSTGRSTSACPI